MFVGLGAVFIVRATGGTTQVEIVKKHLGETINGVYVDKNFIYLWYGSQYPNGTGGVGTTDTTLNHSYYFYVNNDSSQYDAVCLQPTVSYTTINNDTGTETATATAYSSADGADYEKLKLVLMATTSPAFNTRTYGSYSWSDLVGMVAPPASGDFYTVYGGMGYKHPSVYGLESYLVGHILGARLFSANSTNSGYYYIPTSATAAFDATLNAILSDSTLLAQAQNYTRYITPNGTDRQSLGFVKQTSSTPVYEQSAIEICKVDESQNPILDAGTATFSISGTWGGTAFSDIVSTTISNGRNCTAQYVVDTGTTFTYTETVAPTGYDLDSTTHTTTSSTTASTTKTISFINTKTSTPATQRGDLEFYKYRYIVNASNPDSGWTITPWVGKQFTISNGTQTATLTADASGKISTCDNTSIWFGAGSRPSGSGCQGALPVGQYTITEISGNNAYNDNLSYTATVTAGSVVSLDTVQNSFNHPKDELLTLTTTAKDFYATDDSDRTIEAAAGQSIIDHVCYTGLDSSASYQLWGFVYEVGSSLRPDAAEATQVSSGRANAIAYGTQQFSGSANGCVDVTFSSFDATSYAGKSLSIIQYLYRTDSEFNNTAFGILEKIHNYTLTDANETVTVAQAAATPSISSTSAAPVLGYGNLTENKLFVGKTKIADTVVINSATSGTTYYLEAELVDASGAQVALSNASSTAKISGAHRESCVAASSTATCNVELEFDSVAYQGQTLTVYESLFVGDATTPISTHKVLGDSAQSLDVYTAIMSTSAQNPADNTQTVGVGTVTIEDTAHYYNLIPQETYRITGELRTLSGQQLVSTTDTSAHDFTASAATGSETVSFVFDSSAYAGQTLVVFETITRTSDGVEVASHKATNVASQQIQVHEPSIASSTATFAGGAKTIAPATGSIAIADDFVYTGLVAGQNYSVVAKLYTLNNGIADTTNALLTKTATLTPAADSGSFTINLGSVDVSSHAGEQFVVYDYLYFGSTLIASHEQTIADQIITVDTLAPALTATVASADDAAKISGALRIGNLTINDVVNYSNLDTSKSYVLKGSLYHQASASATPALVPDSEVTKTFTPQAEQGSESMTFAINTAGYIGETIIVYEYLYAADGTTLLSSHADATDPNQSLTVATPTIQTTATNPANGASTTIPVAVSAGVNDAIVVDGFVPNDTNQYTLTGAIYKLSDSTTPLTTPITQTNQSPNAAGKITASMDFSLDTSALQGQKLVVWQDVAYNDATIISEHFTDATSSQVVTVATLDPTITTRAYYGQTATTKDAPADIDITIHDEVSLSGLVLGADDYTLTTELVQSDGTLIPLINANSGERAIVTALGPISGSTTETTIDIRFSSLDYTEETLTVFQTLKKGDETIVSHAVATDRDQQIDIAEAPAIVKTTATDAHDGDKTLAANTTAKITDKIEYSGLVPGQTYAMSGRLMDKSTQSLLTAEGVVEATIYFTPEESDGFLEMEFSVNTAGLSGKSIVVFEQLSRESKTTDGETESHIIAKHEAIDSEDQTVSVSIAIPNTGLSEKDNSRATSSRATIAAIAGAIASVGAVIFLKRRHSL